MRDQGERTLQVRTESMSSGRMRFRVTDVHKPLVSAASVVARGNSIYMDKNEAYITDGRTGERTYLHVKNGVYTFPVWLDPPEGSSPSSGSKDIPLIAPMEDEPMEAPAERLPSPFRRRAQLP